MSTVTLYEDETMLEKCGHDFKMVTGNLNIGTAASGGVALDLSKQLPTKVHYVGIDGNGGYVGQYDYTNKKVIIYEAGGDGAALDEVTSGDLSSINMRFIAIGK